MTEREQSSSSRDEQAEFSWDEVLEGAQALGAIEDGTPSIESADSDSDNEQPEVAPGAQPEATTPNGTGSAATDTASDSPSDVASGLDDIPEEYRDLVKKALEEKQKQLQSGFTKKFQELADERKQVQALLAMEQQTGMPPDELIQYAAAFKQLQSAPGIRITQGDNVLWEAPDSEQAEPDWDLMTKAEIAEHFRKEMEASKRELAKQLQDQLSPFQEQQLRTKAQQLGAEWRAKHQDVSDDVISLAVAKATEFERNNPEVAQVLNLDSVEKLDNYMAHFIAQAQALKASASGSTQTSQPRTEVPKTETKAPRRKLDTIEQMAEEAARVLGHHSVSDVMRSIQRD